MFQNWIFKVSMILFLALWGCKTTGPSAPGGVNAYHPNHEELIFQNGFYNSTIFSINSNQDGIYGIDSNLPILNNWAIMTNSPYIGGAAINYEDGDVSQRYAVITNDPLNPSNEVLMFKLIKGHIPTPFGYDKGRVNTFLHTLQGFHGIRQKVKLYLHPDLEYLKTYSNKITWLTIFEIWNRDKETTSGRVSVGIRKTQSGTVSNLYLEVSSDRLLPSGYEDIWNELAVHYPLPTGVWLEFELIIKEGDDNYGSFYLSVKEDEGSEIVLFDITAATMNPLDKLFNGFTEFNPMKLYTRSETIDYLTDNGKSFELYWDDWELYRIY